MVATPKARGVREFTHGFDDEVGVRSVDFGLAAARRRVLEAAPAAVVREVVEAAGLARRDRHGLLQQTLVLRLAAAPP